MACHHVRLASVSAIVCTRNAAPPRVHYVEPNAGLAGIVLCGRNSAKHQTQDPAAVTCQKCLVWIQKCVIGDAAARLTAKFNANSGSKP